MTRTRECLLALCALGVVGLVSSAGCGGTNHGGLPGDDETPGGGGGDASTGSGSSGGGSSGNMVFANSMDAAVAPCTNGGGLGCYVRSDCTTTISGAVYDPAGANPLYNAVVYVPNNPKGTLAPITLGTNSCNTCDVSIGDYVAATLSGPDGKFQLSGVPATSHVPLVVQIGKWRREVFLPTVTACKDNPVTPQQSRLPANHTEGDIPQMALVTGGADNLGCFLHGVGLSDSEYSAPGGSGRLHIYQGLPGGIFGGAPNLTGGGAGDCTTDNPSCVWHSTDNLDKYDIVLLACEGKPYDPAEPGSGPFTNKTPSTKQALHDWLDKGGKVFATHFHYTWFKNGPADFQGVANWLGTSGGSDSSNPTGFGVPAVTYSLDTSFPKGKILSEWLGTVGALSAGNTISLDGVAESVGTLNAGAQRWIYNAGTDPQKQTSDDTKYMSMLTPVGGMPAKQDAGETSAQYCGKAVFTDLHAGGMPMADIPGSCDPVSTTLTAQLKALEFLFFDLSACVATDSQPPPPPPPPIK